ncbi:hypothetical protein SAMN02983003_0694 [Devosia enhydra]|uniref:Uncharacterized protein n=1 Tax=Devosia enhydra TaxID=665118 RepID=A0A1K2HTX3_9HYPH|nr:hypothetical protein [Devosia enhydra]SFZ81792.1 hypothetical protein SAMN02983003_0694 [Devosia enhydra]
MPPIDDADDDVDPKLRPFLAAIDMIQTAQAFGGFDSGPFGRALVARGAALMLVTRGPAETAELLRQTAARLDRKGN